ncbi:RapZ C-terminal domain-containing protein [Embleya sp. NPDC001921]
MTNNQRERTIRIVSFGYGHGPAPEAEITLDLRRRFRNPHHDPAMKQRTGLDNDLYAHVLDTPGVRDPAAMIALAAHELFHTVPGPITIACGCVGGRHRSVGIARHIADILGDGCARVEVGHRDVRRPLLPPAAHATAAITHAHGGDPGRATVDGTPAADPDCPRCQGGGYEWYTARDGEFVTARCSKCRDGRVGR